MMLLCGQTNRIWHYWSGKYPGSVGVLISPSYFNRVPIDRWMPFALDNGAFISWRDKKPWSFYDWQEMIRNVRMTGLTPLWAAVPDVVANKDATLENWKKYSCFVKDIGWPTAFCVQDGMVPKDVPACDVIFVGGTDRWKFPNLQMWTENFPRVHCARVNAPEMIEACDRVGCESVDGTGWFREPSRQDKVPALERFIEGYRNPTPQMFSDTQQVSPVDKKPSL